MTSYYRVMLGRKAFTLPSAWLRRFRRLLTSVSMKTSASFLEDLEILTNNSFQFISRYTPIRQSRRRISLRCVWTEPRGMVKTGDIVGSHQTEQVLIASVKVVGDYYYSAGLVLPHRRKVGWRDTVIARSAMSEALKSSTGSIGTVSNICRPPCGDRAPARRSASTESHPLQRSRHRRPNSLCDGEASGGFPRRQLESDHSQHGVFRYYEEEGEPVGQQYATNRGQSTYSPSAKTRSACLLWNSSAAERVMSLSVRCSAIWVSSRNKSPRTIRRWRGAIIALEDDQRCAGLWSPLFPRSRSIAIRVNFKLVKG